MTVPSNAKVGQAISVVGEDGVPLSDLPTDTMRVVQQDDQKDENMRTAAAVAGVAVVNLALAGTFVVGVRRAWPKLRIPTDTPKE